MKYARPMLVLVLSAGLAGVAHAQSEAPVLKGPEVKDLNAPSRSTFDGKGSPEKRKFAQPDLPHPAFMRVLQETLGPEAPEAIRATDEQKQAIKTIEQEFRDSMKAYMDANQDKIDELRAAGVELRPEGPGQRGRPGERGRKGEGRPPEREDDMMAPPPGEPGPRGERARLSPEEREALMEKARELRENGPNPRDAEAKIWAVLTPEQQAAVKPKLDEMKEDMAKRRGEQAMKAKQRKGGEGGPEGPQGLGDRKGPGGGEGGQLREMLKDMTPEERAVIRERLKNATPDERRQIVEELKAAADK